jgi:hypothetical protein
MALANFLTYNLNFLMQEFKLTANALSQKTGIRAATIYKLKDGVINNPTIETLLPLARHFGFSIDELIAVKLEKLDLNGSFEARGLIPLISINDIEKYPNAPAIRNVNTEFSDTNGKFCIEVLDDDSRFEQGSLLFIDSKTNYENKDFVVVKRIFDSTHSVKKIVFDDEYYLQSTITGLEKKLFSTKDYIVLGVVIGYLKYFKVAK